MNEARCVRAIDDSNMELLSKLLTDDVEWIHGSSEPLLHHAIKSTQLEMLCMLLDAGFPLHLLDENGRTALSLATEDGLIDYVRVLLCYGTHVNIVDDDLQTPLHVAAIYNVYKIAELLLRYGADTDTRDLSENTPLHLAAAYGATDVVDILLRSSFVNVNAVNISGSTALHFAASSGYSTIVQRLLDQGAHVNAVDHLSGNTPLLEAAMVHQSNSMLYAVGDAHTQARVVKILLKYGATVNSMNQQGDTALVGAVRNSYDTVVAELLSHGAISTVLTRQHETLLHVAARANVLVVSLWQQLLNAGVRLDAVDQWQRTCYDVWVSRPKIMNVGVESEGAMQVVNEEEDVLQILKEAIV